MKRRSYKLTGVDGTVNIEMVRIDGGSLEVHEVDEWGDPIHPSIIVHDWHAAREKAADLLGNAIRDGRV